MAIVECGGLGTTTTTSSSSVVDGEGEWDRELALGVVVLFDSHVRFVQAYLETWTLLEEEPTTP